MVLYTAWDRERGGGEPWSSRNDGQACGDDKFAYIFLTKDWENTISPFIIIVIRRSGGHWPNYRACGGGLGRKRPFRGRCQVRTSYVSILQIVTFLKWKKFLTFCMEAIPKSIIKALFHLTYFFDLHCEWTLRSSSTWNLASLLVYKDTIKKNIHRLRNLTVRNPAKVSCKKSAKCVLSKKSA
jgi:hypothetical protein